MHSFRYSLFAVLVAASACRAPEETSLNVQSYVAPHDEFGVGVSSHIIEGPTEALLVDGQLYAADARALVEMLKEQGNELKTVFLTHAHPDHYMGLHIIQEAFPEAAVVTTAEVLESFEATAPATFDALRGQGGDAFADALASPRKVQPSDLEIDGQRIKLLELSGGESRHAAALVLPDSSALIAGDLVYSGIHLYLGECHLEQWRAQLQSLQDEGYSTIYPGHGPAGSATLLLDANLAYIEEAQSIFAEQQELSESGAGAEDPGVAASVEALRTQYPNHGSDYLLQLSTADYFANCAP